MWCDPSLPSCIGVLGIEPWVVPSTWFVSCTVQLLLGPRLVLLDRVRWVDRRNDLHQQHTSAASRPKRYTFGICIPVAKRSICRGSAVSPVSRWPTICAGDVINPRSESNASWFFKDDDILFAVGGILWYPHTVVRLSWTVVCLVLVVVYYRTFCEVNPFIDIVLFFDKLSCCFSFLLLKRVDPEVF